MHLHLAAFFFISLLTPSVSFAPLFLSLQDAYMVMTDKVNTQVDSINRYLNTTTGREKLCRLIQYFARFYAFYLYRCNAPYAEVERWANLKQHIGNGRKLFRLLKPVEFVQAAAQCLDASDEVLHVTGIVKHLGNALYYSSEVFVLVRFDS